MGLISTVAEAESLRLRAGESGKREKNSCEFGNILKNSAKNMAMDAIFEQAGKHLDCRRTFCGQWPKQSLILTPMQCRKRGQWALCS